MNDFLTLTQTNKRIINIILPAVMFVIFAFCPACDIMGKATASGFKVIFDGSGLGFSRVMAILMLALPLLLIILQFATMTLPGSINGKVDALCYGGGFVFFLVYAICLPEMVSPAWAAYMYFVLCLLGLVICYLPNIIKGKK